MRVPILSGLCAALLLLVATPAMANGNGPPNCQPPAPPPVVHIRHVLHPSCGRVVHHVVHRRRVRHVVVKQVVVIQRERVQATCDPCARPPEHHWMPLRGPAGGPDWDWIAANYPDGLHYDHGDRDGMHREWDEHSQSMHREFEQNPQGMHREQHSWSYEEHWSSNCGCYVRRPAATDRFGFLTWPDKTQTWRDQSPDAPPPQ